MIRDLLHVWFGIHDWNYYKEYRTDRQIRQCQRCNVKQARRDTYLTSTVDKWIPIWDYI